MTRAETMRAANAVRVALCGWSGWRRRDFDAALLEQAISGHEHLPQTTLKDDARSRVTAVAAGDATVVVKEVRKSGWRRRLADVFRGSPARRAFVAGHALRGASIDTALPLAFVERRRAGVPLRSLLVSRDLRAFETAADHAAHDPRSALDLLVLLVIRLHRANVVHGDLRAQHIHLCGPDRTPTLIDLEGAHTVRRLSDTQRIRALAELNASLADEIVPSPLRDQALEHYLAALPFTARTRETARNQIILLSQARKHLWRGPPPGDPPPRGGPPPRSGGASTRSGGA